VISFSAFPMYDCMRDLTVNSFFKATTTTTTTTATKLQQQQKQYQKPLRPHL